MTYYEKVMILDPNLDDNAAEETVGKIRDLITKQGGEILKKENWGRRKLAYELNKHQKGNYIFLFFKANPATIFEIEKLCKVLDPIIKFMVVKLTKKKQIEAVLQALAQAAAKSAAHDTKPAVSGEKAPEEKKDVQ